MALCVKFCECNRSIVLYITVNKKVLPSVFTNTDNGKMSVSVFENVYSMRT